MIPRVTATSKARSKKGNAAAAYQSQNYGPNLIPLQQQVRILQGLSKFSQLTQQLPGYSQPAIMYPNHPTLPFTAPVPQQGTIAAPSPSFPILSSQGSNIATNAQPRRMAVDKSRYNPVWHEAN